MSERNVYLCAMTCKSYNRHNFHKHTFCIFQEVDRTVLDPLQPQYTSKSGSTYYFTEEGVYRVSNHWGRAANCKWRLATISSQRYSGKVVGYAAWTSFFPDNDHELLYAIAIDFETLTAQYVHKASQDFPVTTVFRTASETLKRLKVLRQHLTEDQWLRYYNGDPTLVRQQILSEWNSSTLSLEVIKRKYL